MKKNVIIMLLMTGFACGFKGNNDSPQNAHERIFFEYLCGNTNAIIEAESMFYSNDEPLRQGNKFLIDRKFVFNRVIDNKVLVSVQDSGFLEIDSVAYKRGIVYFRITSEKLNNKVNGELPLYSFENRFRSHRANQIVGFYDYLENSRLENEKKLATKYLISEDSLHKIIIKELEKNKSYFPN